MAMPPSNLHVNLQKFKCLECIYIRLYSLQDFNERTFKFSSTLKLVKITSYDKNLDGSEMDLFLLLNSCHKIGFKQLTLVFKNENEGYRNENSIEYDDTHF